MIDRIPIPMAPTWRRKHTGPNGVAKRIDQFLVSEYLIDTLSRYKLWVYISSLSYHSLILLQIDIAEHYAHSIHSNLIILGSWNKV